MTLLFATIANGKLPQIVVSADGLSLAHRGEQQYICSGTTQKLWLCRPDGAAIGQFGQNVIWHEPTSAWVSVAGELETLSKSGSRPKFGDLSHRLIETWQPRVMATLQRPGAADRFAFWVAGIHGNGKALIEELSWERPAEGPVALKRKQLGADAPGTVAAAGAGLESAQQLLAERIDGQYYPERLAGEDLGFALEYHRRFLIAALLEQSRQGKVTFGGHFTTVLISPGDHRTVKLDLS